ncbi:hypothetical protein VE03_08112 [Pseudogymnoascus sp. 23342-1-I1]|nr:hypothetical protein VE03_08112 [Pseudogymnoascus sp. 23342-1-I1]
MSYDLSGRLFDHESPPPSQSQVVPIYGPLVIITVAAFSWSLNEHPLSDSFDIPPSSRRRTLSIYHVISSLPQEWLYLFEAASATGYPHMAKMQYNVGHPRTALDKRHSYSSSSMPGHP